MSQNSQPLTLILLISGLMLSACAGLPGAQPVANPVGQPAAESGDALVEEDASSSDSMSEAAIPDQTTDDVIEETDSRAETTTNPDRFSAPITATGDVLVVSGRVLDVNGTPLEGAAVEFWQTDLLGVYDHPGDPGTDSRDVGFQFYGTSVTDADGNYVFRTILPGRYEPRPRHIHVKVRQDGIVLLTTQFYFAEDGTSGGVGGGIENLLMTLEQDTASDGTLVNTATFDVVVDTGIGAGAMRLTDSQGEGPYYPVVNVSEYDNDLASVEE
jgi:protocatechuate 3,4-dioxygenase beta subunit